MMKEIEIIMMKDERMKDERMKIIMKWILFKVFYWLTSERSS
jgi:hypothetical protein